MKFQLVVVRASSKVGVFAGDAVGILLLALQMVVPRIHPLADHESLFGACRALYLQCTPDQLLADAGGTLCRRRFFLLCGGVKIGRADCHRVPVDMHRSLL